jgi:peptidoglycan LD-endopeptidase LytH
MQIRKSRQQISRTWRIILSIGFVSVLIIGFFGYRWFIRSGGRLERVLAWIRNPGSHPEWSITAGERCGEAPFSMPTDGFIGFMWDDSFRPGHRHQGLDIFGGEENGVTPVYAAYSGFLTRQTDWKSSVIIRIPSDPLNPPQQIWTYYTHMATEDGASYIAAEFPPGTTEVFVEEGVLLGFQGNYSGDPNNPTGIHLHFSIVQDDGNGFYLNELKIQNTSDPSPYLGMNVNANTNPGEIAECNE